MTTATSDFHPIAKPSWYHNHASGVSSIEIAERLSANLSHAFDYVWRAHHKHASPVEDLRKALWFVRRERDHGRGYPPPGIMDTHDLLNRVLEAEPNELIAYALGMIWHAAACPRDSWFTRAEHAVCELLRATGETP